MLHTVGEAAADRTTTAADHRHSAAGAATLATLAGGPGLPVPGAGAAVAVVVAGAAEGFVAEGAVSGARLGGQSITVRKPDEVQRLED